MYKGKKILATICARGGSKGVRNKNIRPLGGKPLIIRSMEITASSKYIDEYIVSTESDAIAQVVKDHGYKIIYKRPDYLAEDKVSRIDAIRHAVNWMEDKNDFAFDVIIDIGVATPLKSTEDLDGCIELLVDSGSDNVLSVTPSPKNPYYNMVEDCNGLIQKVKKLPEHITDRRDAPKVYDMNDGFNVWNHDVLFSESPQFNNKTKIYIMPPERSVDIDNEIDFQFAETLLKNNNKI